jgi:hypothetical protein
MDEEPHRNQNSRAVVAQNVSIEGRGCLRWRIKKESVEDLFANDRRLGSLEEQDPDSALKFKSNTDPH